MFKILTYIRSNCAKSTDEEMANVLGQTDMVIWKKVQSRVPIKRIQDVLESMPFDSNESKERFRFLLR